MAPRTRRRMAGSSMGEGDSAPQTDESNGGTPPNAAPADAPTIFVKKEMLGDKDWAVGDGVIFQIKSIDPETGEVELFYAPEKPGEDHMEEPADAMSEMDKQFPADENAGGGY